MIFRLRVPDDAQDLGKLNQHPPLDLIHSLVHDLDGDGGIDATMKIDGPPPRGLSRANIVNVAKPANLKRMMMKRRNDLFARHRINIDAGHHMRRHWIDVSFNFDIRAKFIADGALEIRCDGVSAPHRHGAIDFDIDADRKPIANLLRNDVMRRQMAPRRDQQRAFDDRLVIQRAWLDHHGD